MSFDSCAQKMGKLLSKSQAARVSSETERLTNLYADDPRFQGMDIKAKAESDALNSVVNQVKLDQYKVAKTAERLDTLSTYLDTASGGSRPMHDALQSFLVTDSTGRFKTPDNAPSVFSSAEGIFGQATAKLFPFVDKYSSKIPGGLDSFFQSRKTASEDLVRGLFGEATKDPVVGDIVKPLKDTMATMWQRFKDAGANVHTLEDYALPMSRNRESIIAIPREDYINKIRAGMNPTRMRDLQGNQLPEQDIRNIIGNEWDEKRLDKPVAYNNQSGVIKKYQQERIYHWKDAESYLKIANEFGAPDPYTSIMEYIHKLAKDTSLVEHMGPNPDAVFKGLLSKVEASGEPDYKLHSLQSIYDIIRGRSTGLNNIPYMEAINAASTWQVATKLGSALLPHATTLPAYASNEIHALGGSAVKWAGGLLKGLNPIGNSAKGMRRLAAELGQPLEYAMSRSIAATREMDMVGTSKLSNIATSAADGVMRLSGLNSYLIAAKASYYVEAMRAMTDQVGKEFGDLNPNFKQLLDQYHITPENWQSYRDSIRPFKSSFGEKPFIDITGIKDNDALARLHALVTDSESYAVPQTNPLTQSITNRGISSGSTLGKKFLGQFMSYTTSAWMGAVRRSMFNPAFGGTASRVLNAARFGLYLTAAGTLSNQLFNLTKGQDLEKWDSPLLWAKGFLRSGGGGFFGDAIERIMRSEGDKAKLISGFMGPLAGDAGGIISLLSQGALASAHSILPVKWGGTKDPTHKEWKAVGKQGVDLGVSFLPGNNLWYAKKALTANLTYGLDHVIDPQGTQDHFKRLNNNLQKQTGQGTWWPTGSGLPTRLPGKAK